MFMFCSIVCKCAALNDATTIFHRMLTATKQNIYFDHATCSFAQKVIVIVIN